MVRFEASGSNDENGQEPTRRMACELSDHLRDRKGGAPNAPFCCHLREGGGPILTNGIPAFAGTTVKGAFRESQARWLTLPLTANAAKNLALILVAVFVLSAACLAQSNTGTVRGQVTDPSGAVVPAIAVVVAGAEGPAQEVQTNEEGRYVLQNLAAGTYTVRVQLKGFADFQSDPVAVGAGQTQVIDVKLTVTLEKQKVTVTDTTTALSVSQDNNASALVLKGKDLDALSDDPDELQSQLQALAGPAAGPNGGEIYIDGFSGGQLPAKSAIREIRVNQNPFSAQYDKLGYGRIEILTKPGQDKWHGQAFSMFNTSALNSRNPFVSEEPGYHREFFDGSIGGPLSKKASLFVDGGRRDINANSIVSATVLDSGLQETPLSQAVRSPHTNTNLSTRLDYQLTTNNTLTARYQFWQDNATNNGVGQLALASQGYDAHEREHTVQISDSQVLSPRVVNDLRFEYTGQSTRDLPVSQDPTLQVQGAFTSGESSLGKVLDNEDHYELHDLLSVSRGKHCLTFGGRLRDVNEWNSSNANFNGAFTFASLAAYQTAELQLLVCKTAGGSNCQVSGASQFSLTTGKAAASVNWVDVGLFAEDQWRLRSNMSLSLGLRYATQNSIHDHADFAPRVGFAWGLGHGKSAKTVVRAGFGLFYDRFAESQVMQAERLNGLNQTQYVVLTPDFFPTIPSVSVLEQIATAQSAKTIYQTASDLRAPYTIQSAVGVERQLTSKATFSVTYVNSHGVHQFLTRNINAPLPGTYVACTTGDTSCTASDGVRPYGDVGNIYQYESDGLFNQNQVITNFNIRTGTRVSLFGFYSLGFANGNTAGVSTFPSNSYDIAADYGRAAFDVRHRLFIGGSLSLPKGFRLSPFMMTSSGSPFNITTGAQTIQGTTARPTINGVFIGRNAGQGFDFLSLGVRLSRSFPLTERLRLQMLAEGFNLTNHVNGVSLNGNFGTGAYPTNPSSSFRQVTAVGDPRAFQLAMRLAF